ncbi:hypothetical protein DFH08DRAFT_1049879 [Mycena albidolilacea]|uniref:Uncharacterized protein n=1 Tax=Mycena albidolilacea TaxID=1033008 RepID=A0AAD6Z7E2_9AGAR|nr:hypothetical protein DFH08DRAFT_1049879 [Mycena albidolilacea]
MPAAAKRLRASGNASGSENGPAPAEMLAAAKMPAAARMEGVWGSTAPPCPRSGRRPYQVFERGAGTRSIDHVLLDGPSPFCVWSADGFSLLDGLHRALWGGCLIRLLQYEVNSGVWKIRALSSASRSGQILIWVGRHSELQELQRGVLASIWSFLRRTKNRANLWGQVDSRRRRDISRWSSSENRSFRVTPVPVNKLQSSSNESLGSTVNCWSTPRRPHTRLLQTWKEIDQCRVAGGGGNAASDAVADRILDLILSRFHFVRSAVLALKSFFFDLAAIL